MGAVDDISEARAACIAMAGSRNQDYDQEIPELTALNT
jgi:hypothetical protein